MLEIGLEVVGMGDLLESPPEQLLGRVPGDLADPVVDPQPSPLDADQRHPDRCVLEGPLEALAGLAQLGLRALGRGDVAGDGDTPEDLAGLAAPRVDLEQEERIAVLGTPAQLDRAGLAAQRRRVERLEYGPAVRREDLGCPVALEGPGAPAVSVHDLAQREDVAEIVVEDEDRHVGQPAQRREGEFPQVPARGSARHCLVHRYERYRRAALNPEWEVGPFDCQIGASKVPRRWETDGGVTKAASAWLNAS